MPSTPHRVQNTFPSLNLRFSYLQIPMYESDKEKTAFATPDSLFDFNVMPSGLCDAPATFERMINTVLQGLKIADLSLLPG